MQQENKFGIVPSFIVNQTGRGLCLNLSDLVIGGFRVVKPCAPDEAIKKRTQWWECKCEDCGHIQKFRSDMLVKGFSGKCKKCGV